MTMLPKPSVEGRRMTSQIKSYSAINKVTDSTVKMSRRLTADVDAWAEAHDTVRSAAIRQLVELGLSSTSSVDPLRAARRDSEIEDLAVEQIGQLLDPSLPIAERERRIRRLTAGPPELSGTKKGKNRARFSGGRSLVQARGG